jgi:hypothetical protein
MTVSGLTSGGGGSACVRRRRAHERILRFNFFWRKRRLRAHGSPFTAPAMGRPDVKDLRRCRLVLDYGAASTARGSGAP